MVFEIVLPFLQSDSHCSLLIMIRPKIVQENIRPFTICHYLGLITPHSENIIPTPKSLPQAADAILRAQRVTSVTV